VETPQNTERVGMKQVEEGWILIKKNRCCNSREQGVGGARPRTVCEEYFRGEVDESQNKY